MSTELLINVTPQETRVAQVENGMLQEVLIERAHVNGRVGNIYKGKVIRVLPGMQAAFVDIGLERSAFLHAADIVSQPPGEDVPSIRDLLREGQDILVQVVKDPLGSKGARLSMALSLASRYLVYMPAQQPQKLLTATVLADQSHNHNQASSEAKAPVDTHADMRPSNRVADGEVNSASDQCSANDQDSANTGISLRIDDQEERDRLKAVMQAIVPAGQEGTFIVRTAGQHMKTEALQADCQFLVKLWALIAERAKQTSSGELVHGDLPLVLKAFRDLLTPEVSAVSIDSAEAYEQVSGFLKTFMPHLQDSVRHYTGTGPLFDLYSVEDEILKALDRRVDLKSGGYLVFDQTEAMTTVDVNTGGYVGHRNLEETIFKTNLEAAQAIARQLRLRNLGGIIILDFIDMQSASHREQVLQALNAALECDHARTKVCEVSSLGLVEMTRQRTRESLEQILCESCPTCAGRGVVRSAETITFEIYREIVRSARQFNAGQPMVMAAEPVINHLLDHQSDALAELEDFIGRPIRLQAEASYPPDQYDVVLI